MADERISSFITPEALAELASADAAIESITQSIINANAAAKKAEGFSTQAKSIEEVAKAQKKLSDASGTLVVSASKLEAQQKRNEAAAAREKKAIDDIENDYKQLSLAYNEAALRAKNYAIRLGETHAITVQAVKDANDLANVLKRLDASVGQNQRSVGNYSIATNGLRNSFQQIARELPSISNGFATFASAIGNNIAPAQDAIKAFVAEQKALKAQGLPTQSLLAAMAGSIFNVQTALLLGVTALTVYGKQIGEFIIGTKKATVANDDFGASLDDLNEKIEFGAKNLDSAAKLRIAQAKARGASDKEIAAIEQEGYKERLAKQEAFIKESIDNEIYYNDLLTKVQGGIKVKTAEGVLLKEEDLANNLAKARKETVKLREQANKIENDAAVAAFEAAAPSKERIKRVKDLTDELQKLRDLMQEFANEQRNPSKTELDQIASDLAKDSALGGVGFDVFDKDAEKRAAAKAKGLLDILDNFFKEKKIKSDNDVDREKKEQEIRDRAAALAASASQFAGELDSLSEAISARRIAELDNEIKKINEKRQADINAIEAKGLSEEETRARIADINIKADADEKKRDTEKIARQRRAAIFEKSVNVAQIIAATALAVIKAYTEGDPYTKVARSILAGVTGAAQLAAALAAPIPQYEEGTKGKAHKGGPARLFEGDKMEAVIENGRIWTGDKEGIYDLAAGAHVVSNKDLMRMANMYTLGMPALIPQRNRMMDNEAIKQGLEQVRKAIENKPVSQMSITNGGITGLVRTGQQNIQYLNNLKC